MRRPSRVSACRRKVNSHEAVEPQGVSRPSLGAPEQVVAEQSPIRANLCGCLVHKLGAETGSGSPQRKDMRPLCQIEPPACVGSTGFQSVRRAAAVSSASVCRTSVAAA